MVECDLAKVEVAGSNPVSRSTFALEVARRLSAVARKISERRWASASLELRLASQPRTEIGERTRDRILRNSKSAPSPSGKAEVCKTSIPGSNPGGASNFHSGN